MARSRAFKPYQEWRNEKENQGKLTWTLALYGTEAMAREAQLTIEEYWQQIISACYLDEHDPIQKWTHVFQEVERVRAKLNNLEIEKVRVIAPDTDLTVGLGANRQWLGGSGRNIPSFEVFISPDARLTEGHIRFNQPPYIAKTECNNDDKVVIVSTDKDFMQLINEKLSVYNPTQKKLYDVDAIVERFGRRKCI
jgi:aminopeptidase